MSFTVFLALILSLLVLGDLAVAGREPSIKTCSVLKDWNKGLSGKEICTLNEAGFCSSVQTVREGICLASGGSFCSTVKSTGEGVCLALHGSFCTTVHSLAEGICLGLDESFCTSLTNSDDRLWSLKLTKKCEGLNLHQPQGRGASSK
jgi:hypothetical protein